MYYVSGLCVAVEAAEDEVDAEVGDDDREEGKEAIEMEDAPSAQTH